MMKYLQAVILSCLLITMLGCASTRCKPQLNPHPKHFLTIKGHIAPELKDKVYLAFVQIYATNNKECLVVTNWLAGVKGYPTKTVIFIPTVFQDGKYIVKIPLDKYLPGKGEWASWALGYSLTTSAKDPILGSGMVSYEKHTQPIPKFYNLICHNGPDDCKIDTPKGYLDLLVINPNQSHTINMNILYRKEK